MAYNVDTIKRIAEMTQDNLHTEALMEGAKMLDMTFLVKRLEHVHALWKLEGHMPHDLSNYSYHLFKQFHEAAKKILTPEQYEALNNAY